MMAMVESMRNIVERSAFGVCQALSDMIGIRVGKVRLFFIYTSFVALGSPAIIYLILAFWMNMKRYVANSAARLVLD